MLHGFWMEVKILDHTGRGKGYVEYDCDGYRSRQYHSCQVIVSIPDIHHRPITRCSLGVYL